MKQWLWVLVLLPLLGCGALAQGWESLNGKMPAEVREITRGAGQDDLVEKAGKSLMQKGVGLFRQHLQDSCRASLLILALCALLGLGQSFAAGAQITLPADVLPMTGVCAVTAIALAGTGSLISACGQSLEELSMMLKSLMPTFVTAMAASGNPVSSVATSSGTLLFANLLISLGKSIVFPAVNLYIVVTAAGLIAQNPLLRKVAQCIRWACMGGYKILLMIFTMYITMSGILSAGADAAATKAAKVTISGVVPVLGTILADASDTLLTGARVLKNGIGIFGMVAAVAICLAPFVRSLCFLLVYRVTSALGGSFAGGAVAQMLDAIGDGCTLLLGLLGACCALVFLSMVVCTTVVVGP